MMHLTMQTAYQIVLQYYLAICKALPAGDMLSVVTDSLRYSSSINSTVVNYYVECLNMVNNNNIKFW